MDISKFNGILTKKRIWAGVLLAQFLLFYILSKSEKAVSFFEWFFEKQKNAHTFLPSRISFSIGDAFYTLLSLFIIFKLIQIFRRKTRKKAVFQLLVLANVFYFVYQIFWGMLYFQKPIKEKLKPAEINNQILKELAIKELEICKKLREQLHENEKGIFTLVDVKKIQLEVLQNQSKIPLEISKKKPIIYNNIKPSLFSFIEGYTGILGYYNPFTSEAQYNQYLPDTYIPFTIAHESAHQLGFAREQEANFIAYMLGKNSTDISLKYATHYFTLRSLINALSYSDEVTAKKMLDSYSEAMKRDRNYELAFREKHSGKVDAFFGFTNDLFLKTNQQEGAITYSYFVELLVQYENQNKSH